MRLKLPNQKAVTMLFFGVISLIMWYMLSTDATATSWQSTLQKIALLIVGGLLTIYGAKFAWISMKNDQTNDK